MKTTLFRDRAKSIIKRIMRENNINTEDELRELLDEPTDNVKHFLFDYDLKQLLKQKRPKKFETILERLGFDSEEQFEQTKNIYFDTVIMDEASKATPPRFGSSFMLRQKEHYHRRPSTVASNAL
ncbi:hypothetical protein NIB75_16680 [Bacteroides uniformis]|nr:hypothetical protein [Bacteroides uniformis]